MQTRNLGLRGFTLALASVLTLGLAACEDTETVTPAAPVTISVSPTGTVDLTVGQTFQVVASVQNATNPAISYTTSNAAVATVDNAGVVRAVAAGTATITAASVEDPNAKQGVFVRVTTGIDPTPPGDSANVVVEAIVNNENNPVDESSVAGTIFARFDVTPGRADSLIVMLGNTTVCRQTFNQPTPAAASAEGVSAAAAAAEFVCTVNTTRTNTDGSPTFPNGATSLTARLYDNGTIIASASRNITLRNTNTLGTPAVTADSSAINPETGLAWQGGDLTVTVRPAIFSGGQVTQVTLDIDSDDPDFAGFDAIVDETVDGGAFVFEIDADDLADITDDALTISFTSRTATGATEGPTTTRVLRYDNEAPTGPDALAEQDFLGPQADLEDLLADDYIDNDEDVVDEADEDTGVNDVSFRFFVADAGDLADLDDIEDVMDAGTEIDSAEDLEEFDGEELDIAAIVTDALGNMRLITGFDFEVDMTAPTFEVDEDTLIFAVGDATTGTIEVEVEDDVAGFDGPGLYVSATRTWLNADGDELVRCVIGDEATAANIDAAFTGVDDADYRGAEVGSADSVCEPVEIGNAIPEPDGVGYYVFTIRSIDAAGNISEESATINVLVDQEAPEVDDVEFSASLTGGEEETFTAEATDNLDLDSYAVGINYTGFGILPLTGNISIDNTFGTPLTDEAELEAEAFFVESMTLDTNTGAGITLAGDYEADEVVFNAYDHAFNVSPTGVFAIGQSFGAITEFADGDVNGFDVTVDGTEDDICLEEDCEDGANTRTIRATITKDEDAATDEPVDRVYFYAVYDVAGNEAYRLIGVDESASTSVSLTTRSFAYTAQISVEDIADIYDAGDTVTVFALAVDADGQGIGEFNTELTAVED